jgi:hypothetical protein
VRPNGDKMLEGKLVQLRWRRRLERPVVP